jgi:hypothetical protein
MHEVRESGSLSLFVSLSLSLSLARSLALSSAPLRTSLVSPSLDWFSLARACLAKRVRRETLRYAVV